MSKKRKKASKPAPVLLPPPDTGKEAAMKRLAQDLPRLGGLLADLEAASMRRHLPKGVDARAARVCGAVHIVGLSGIGAIAEYMGITQAAMSDYIPKLKKLGLIERTEDPDPRKKAFVLSRRGGVVRMQLGKVRAEMARTLYEMIPAGEREHFLSTLSTTLAAEVLVPIAVADDVPSLPPKREPVVKPKRRKKGARTNRIVQPGEKPPEAAA